MGEGLDVRYEYWPSLKTRQPLLYFCAATLLGGDGNSTCFNERMHSPAGRITEKYRASMLPDSVERLTLGYFFVRREFLAKKEELKQATAPFEAVRGGAGKARAGGGAAGAEGGDLPAT